MQGWQIEQGRVEVNGVDRPHDHARKAEGDDGKSALGEVRRTVLEHSTLWRRGPGVRVGSGRRRRAPSPRGARRLPEAASCPIRRPCPAPPPCPLPGGRMVSAQRPHPAKGRGESDLMPEKSRFQT